MSFTACTFTYNGISSEEFGLTLCEIGNEKMSGGVINSGFSVVSEHISRRAEPIHYGVKKGDHKEFDLVFGSDQYLSRVEVAEIAGWLLGRNQFAPLVIEQEDLVGLQYKAIFTEMKMVPVGGKTIGFSAHVVCNSPYAYTESVTDVHECSGTLDTAFTNMSNIPELYAPDVRIEVAANSDVKVLNKTTGETFSLEFGGKNTSKMTVHISGLTKVMTLESDQNLTLNLYDCMKLNGAAHFVFPRFAPGVNALTLTGNFKLFIDSEFPMAIGY